MQWEATGADRGTGQDRTIRIEAETEDSARRRANRQGILVEQIRPLDPDDSVIGSVPAQAIHYATPAAPRVSSHSVPLPTGRPASGLGVAALVIGIVAIAICWLPFAGLAIIPLAFIGFVLGFVGIIVSATGRRSGLGLPIAGTAVSGVAIVFPIILAGFIVHSAVRAIVAMPPSRPYSPAATTPAGPVSFGAPTPPPSSAAAPAAAPDPWAGATDSARLGDVTVKVVSCEVGKVPMRTMFGDPTTSQDDDLIVKLAITNSNPARKIDYSTWAGRELAFMETPAQLSDELGNTYKRVDFGASNRVVGHIESDALYPGKPLTDVLVFEQPLPAAKLLRLELPAQNVGGTGDPARLAFISPAPSSAPATDP